MTAVGTKALKLLMVEDNELDADLAARALRSADLDFEYQVVRNEAGLRAALERLRPDVILCDFAFPDFDGLTALRIVRETSPATPVIFVSGTLSEERAVMALQNGAADYVLKSNLVRLPAAVSRAVEQAAEHKRRLAAEERVQQLSRTKDVLASVNSAIVRLRDRLELFTEACRIAMDEGGFAQTFVLTIDRDSNRAAIPALIGLGPESHDTRLAFMQRILDNLENAPGAVAESLRTSQPATRKLAEHPEMYLQKEMLAEGIRAVASFPIVIDGKILGVIVFSAYEASHFDIEEMQLLASLTNNLAFALDLMEKQRRVDYLSYYDPITDLPNRSLFTERLRSSISAIRPGESAAVMLLDVRRFSALNTTLGERAGDELLRACAARLVERFGTDQVARWPGNRFAICFPALKSLQPIVDQLADEGLRLFAPPFTVDGHTLVVNVRVGCAMFPQDAHDAETLIHDADIALQNARSSDAPYQFYSTTQSKALQERVDLEDRLRRAIEQRQFRLFYQPKVDLATRAIVGLEALIRWPDPHGDGSLVPPNDFVPVLEETGLIVEVGRWALREAARQYAKWRADGLKAPRIAVNLSARQLDGSVVAQVRDAVKLCGDECGLDIEITESMLMENVADAAAKLREMRDLGVEIALDDFGTGYSSLSVLQQLPLSSIKIDRSFVNGMTEDASKTTMISTIILLAQANGFKVIAEGVENEKEAHLLHLLKCDQMQGFLFAHPLPPEAIAPMLEADVR